MYTGMGCRVRNLPTYKGKKVLFSRDEFIKFISKDKNFPLLYENWVKSDYSNRLAPSVDKIDNEGDYSLDNIQIMAKGENTSKSNK